MQSSVFLSCCLLLSSCRLSSYKCDSISPLDDLAFDMYQDPEVAHIIRLLDQKKLDMVREERFDLAKKLKQAIADLQKVIRFTFFIRHIFVCTCSLIIIVHTGEVKLELRGLKCIRVYSNRAVATYSYLLIIA